MQCQACGTELTDNAAFCENCGASAAIPEPLPEGIMENSAAEDGVRRWMFELNLWKNPTVAITVFKVVALAALFPALLTLVLGIMEGDGAGALMVFIKIYGGLLVGMSLLMVLGYSLVAAINGGKYCVIFEMDDQGVRHTQLQKQFDRAQAMGLLTSLMGMMANSPATMGAGLLAASKQSTYSRFGNVRSVTVNSRRRVVYLTTKQMVHNQIYAEKEDFEEIVAHILAHVPKTVTVKRK